MRLDDYTDSRLDLEEDKLATLKEISTSLASIRTSLFWISLGVRLAWLFGIAVAVLLFCGVVSGITFSQFFG